MLCMTSIKSLTAFDFCVRIFFSSLQVIEIHLKLPNQGWEGMYGLITGKGRERKKSSNVALRCLKYNVNSLSPLATFWPCVSVLVLFSGGIFTCDS